MRARAIRDWAIRDGRCNVTIFQTLESLSPLWSFGVSLYNWIQLKAPWLHHVYFNFLEMAALHRSPAAIRGTALTRFQQQLRETNPDCIVSTHAHLNHAFFEVAKREAGPELRCMTYCGELHGGYGFSRHWVNPNADGFFAAVPECQHAARHLKMPEDRNHVAGFMLNPAFWEQDPAVSDPLPVRRHDAPLVILSTGANSANNHLNLLNSIESDPPDAHFVALCGSNQDAISAVNEWATRHPQISVEAMPRIDSTAMHSLMRKASAIVARPGTGTTSEAILAGCPILHNGIGGIMPQEWITVRFMRRHGMDKVFTRSKDFPNRLRQILQPDVQEDLRQRLEKAKPAQLPSQFIDQLVSCAK